MFRLSHYMNMLVRDEWPTRRVDNAGRNTRPTGPVVIWNLIRRCNLLCKHCYAISGNVDFPGELSFRQVCEVMDDLKQYGVPALILSGGEPLLRPDIFDIARRARDMGFFTALSTNGVLITEVIMNDLASIGFDYIGISLDGIGEVHDAFRGMKGAYQKSLNALRLCRDAGIPVGVRYTMTRDNAYQFEHMIALVQEENIDRFYLSHLVYAGRGNKNRMDDADLARTRTTMHRLIEWAEEEAKAGSGRQIVTGNNDADGVYLLLWAREHYPDRSEKLERVLRRWGGNQSGVMVANIDNVGDVHPDTMWWHYTLGNVKERPFSEIWKDTSDPLMAGLKQRPRPVKGRCAECKYLSICNGNTRVRAQQLTGDAWAEDPACYLTDEEIGIPPRERAVRLTPFRGRRHATTGA